MDSSVEYQVRCMRCGHAHNEPIEWLMAHGEVECTAEDGCGARIQIPIGNLRAPARGADQRFEVLDLSKWQPETTTQSFARARHRLSGHRRA